MQNKTFSASLSALLAGAVLSVAATGAMAQTTAPMTNPTTVGVTPQDAAEANRKAVPRSDTATVVRTDESAADKARDAADKAKAKTNMTTPVTTQTQGNASATSSMSDGTSSTTTNRTMQRRARADRN